MGASLLINATSSVVVDYLDVFGASLGPGEADPPLVIDPDAVLASAVALQRFQPVARRHAEIVESHSSIQNRQFSQSRPETPRIKRPHSLALPETLGVAVPE